MLDLVFLVLMIIVLKKSLKGDVNELMCNIANVVGVLAAILGMITAFNSEDDLFWFGIMNIFVFIISFLVKPVANHFAKLYHNKIEEEIRSYNEDVERINANFFRKQASDTAYLHEVERQNYPPEGFSQKGNAMPNPMVTNNVVFSPDGSVMPNPTAANNAAFPQNGNVMPNPMVTNNAILPQNDKMADDPEEDGIMPSLNLNKPIDSGSDDNYGLPYDLSAPIDLDRGIDDISIDNKK